MIRNWLRNFMIGRYGPDQLGVALIVSSLVLYVLAAIIGVPVISFIAYAAMLFEMFRMLSRNIQKRRAENDKFIKFWWPIRQKLKFRIEKLKSAGKYKFFKCPACGNNLRVPKGKGKIKITCPKCGERFEKKT